MLIFTHRDGLFLKMEIKKKAEKLAKVRYKLRNTVVSRKGREI
jgi:hypothetical protein